MPSSAGDRPSAEFMRELRRALRHLYDPDVLRGSRLAGLLAIDERHGPGSLQQALTAAIEALKPRSGVSNQSNAWRTYRALSARYLQQFRQAEVAKSLGLSIRQMRRQDSLALRTLAEYLWGHYELGGNAAAKDALTAGTTASTVELEQEPLSREEELQWVERSLSSEPVDVREMLGALADTVAPLAAALDTRLHCALHDGLPRLMLQAATLRQALLNVLTVAIRHAPGGTVDVRAETCAQILEITIRVPSPPLLASAPEDQVEGMEMARQLLALSGGSLQLAATGAAAPFAATLRLPAVEQATVLIIDDNVDALQLYQRYLAGSRYAFAGTSDAQQAVPMAGVYGPCAVVLDVMLPGVDGWELLGRLRAHPRLQGVPIIVCTILPQEQLALALGAAAFVRKPVSRTDLLAALDRCLAPPSPGSCL